METVTRRDDCINYSSGAGGFLDPPTYPTHTTSIETDLRRRPENRNIVALTASAEYEWVSEETRKEAQRILDEWARPPLESPEVQKWIRQVLGYFRGCYRNPDAKGGEQYHASNVVIDRDRDPVEAGGDHAGVRHIHKWYPEWVPTPEDFASARWDD